MKKWLTGIFIICILSLILIYIFIPATLHISDNVVVKANTPGSYRALTDESNWEKILGSKPNNNSFTYNNCTFIFNKKIFNGVEVNIKNKNLTANGVLSVFPV